MAESVREPPTHNVKEAEEHVLVQDLPAPVTVGAGLPVMPEKVCSARRDTTNVAQRVGLAPKEQALGRCGETRLRTERSITFIF